MPSRGPCGAASGAGRSGRSTGRAVDVVLRLRLDGVSRSSASTCTKSATFFIPAHVDLLRHVGRPVVLAVRAGVEEQHRHLLAVERVVVARPGAGGQRAELEVDLLAGGVHQLVEAVAGAGAVDDAAGPSCRRRPSQSAGTGLLRPIMSMLIIAAVFSSGNSGSLQ